MAATGEIVINSETYSLMADSQLPSGKRAYVRGLRETQDSDPGRVKTMRWKLSGPMGQSTERDDGFLGCDYTVNLEHRFDDLLTSVATRNAVTLSGSDPIASTAAVLGGFALGGAALGGGTSNAFPQNASHMDEDRGYLFVHRGAFSTQVNIAAASPTVVDTETHDSTVKGAAVWRGRGRLGLGSNGVMRQRTAVTTTGATYANQQVSAVDQYAYELTVGSDRLWMVDGNSGAVGRVKYTLDNFSSISNPFDVGDRDVLATGIGTLGPLTSTGRLNGVWSFTDSGKPVPITKSMYGHRSENNGAHFAEQWGWQYQATDFGLYAWNGGSVVNPAGPEALEGFEGPIDGPCIHVYAWREALLAIFLGTDGHSYMMWGLFNPDVTPTTGRPDWYTFRRFSSTECHCIFSTNLRTNPTLLVGEGANTLSYYTMGRRKRDIADGNYSSSTGGGEWYGSTSRRDPTMRKNLRYGKFITENGAAGRTWQLAVSVDGGSYVNVGSATTTSGIQTVRPVSGSTPLTTVNGFTFKPKLTQASDSTTTPAQIRGFLELAYDERPEQVEEIVIAIRLGGVKTLETERTNLHALAEQSQGSPVSVTLPGETTAIQCLVASVEQEQDYRGDGNRSVVVRLHRWETS